MVLLGDPAGAGQAPTVLLLERPAHASFAPGSLVFPGGSVDEADRDPAWADLSQLPDDAGFDPRAPLAIRIAGIRETFEESGILLARRDDGAPLTDADWSGMIEIRHRLRAGGAAIFRSEMAAHGLKPDVRSLRFCAHWITPEGLPRRFDTRFFMTVLPPGQTAQADPLREHVSLQWADPAGALASAEEGLAQLLPPTRAVLRQVALARSVDEALCRAQEEPIETIQPVLRDVTEENFPGLDVSRLDGRPPQD